MGYQVSNPIQQRIEQFLEKWEEARATDGIKMVRIVSQENEEEMVDTFFHYLFGTDTGNKDVPIIFDIPFSELWDYSTDLLHELEELLYLWNNVSDNKTGTEIQAVDWKPNYNLKDSKNPAYLFVQNINELKQFLQLDEDAWFVLIIDERTMQKKEFLTWLEFALNTEIDNRICFAVADTFKSPYFKKLSQALPEKVTVLTPDFNMENAMQQLASMGNPNDPVVQYRQAFVKLGQAVGKRDKKAVKKYSNICFDIVKANIKKDVNWYAQIIVIYTLLVNDQIGYKNYKNAQDLATKAIDVAQSTYTVYEDEFIPNKYLAQTRMTRGSLYTMTKDWEKCFNDFEKSCQLFQKTNDNILAIESARMCGYAQKKNWSLSSAQDILIEAYNVGKKTPETLLTTSTFGGVVEYLFELGMDKHFHKDDYIPFLERIYGEEWHIEISAWRKPNKERQESPEATDLMTLEKTESNA